MLNILITTDVYISNIIIKIKINYKITHNRNLKIIKNGGLNLKCLNSF